MASPVEQMAEYVKGNYTMQGIEVATTGIGSMRLKMPYEMHDLHDFVDDLVSQFGAAVDLEQQADGTDLIVYPDRRRPRLQQVVPPLRGQPVCVAVAAMAGALLLLLATVWQLRQLWASDGSP